MVWLISGLKRLIFGKKEKTKIQPDVSIITISNQKGGVGKTITSINLAVNLSNLGKRVLLIDLDPQGNATSGLGLDKNSLTKNIYHALIGHASMDEVISTTKFENLGVVGANMDLVGAEIELAQIENRHKRLTNICQRILSKYDYIIIDTPPGLGILTLNALVFSNKLIIPVKADDYYSIEGLAQLLKFLEKVKIDMNPDIQLFGILFTICENNDLSKEIMENIGGFFKNDVFKTVIPRDMKLAEGPSHGKPAIEYDSESQGSNAYIELTKEVIENDSIRKGG